MLNLLSLISARLGVQVEAVALIVALFYGYVVCLLYSVFFQNKSASFKRIYFLATGFFIVTWSYGINALHSLINCCFCYLTLKCISTKIAVTVNLLFTMIYLLYGYHLNQTDWNYSITWTTSQCVMTLRLIAFSFDILDWNKQKIKQSEDKIRLRDYNSAIEKCPSIVNFLSYCYFPGAFFVGPLFPFVLYEDFLQRTNQEYKENIKTSLLRLLGSFLILIIYMLGSSYWPIEYLLSDEFKNLSLFWKLTSIGIVCKICMYKYILCWLIAESACIVADIDHTGIGLCTNIKYLSFETAISFTEIIKCYNISTNNFAFKYIYKRLKFLGNVYISQIITLTFLSIWHGFESGYHMTFFIEFLLLFFEKTSIPLRKQWLNRIHFNYYWNILTFIIGRLYTFYFLSYGFLPLMFLYKELWLPIFTSVYFIGHLFLCSYLLIILLTSQLYLFWTK